MKAGLGPYLIGTVQFFTTALFWTFNVDRLAYKAAAIIL